MGDAGQHAQLDDAALIAEAARGEVKALAALYDRYSQLMLNVAQRILGDREIAEDLVHDVFVEAWRNAASYDPSRGSVRTWIMVRLRSRALDRKRSAVFRREVAVDKLPVGTDDGSAADELAAAPDRELVRAALAELPDEQRQVLELAYFEGLSSTEIAKRMDSPVGTVKSRTAAAISKLRSAMAKGDAS
jgi:RNA polymerase sigma-70 factor (ECF subfamily)